VISSVNSGFPLVRVAVGVTSPGVKESPETIKKAAEQFEALLIGQILKSAREGGSSGWLGTGEDEAGQTGVDMAEQQFASVLATQGGLGLSKFITSSLASKT
jgi:flagellar protein FlgJ